MVNHQLECQFKLDSSIEVAHEAAWLYHFVYKGLLAIRLPYMKSTSRVLLSHNLGLWSHNLGLWSLYLNYVIMYYGTNCASVM